MPVPTLTFLAPPSFGDDQGDRADDRAADAAIPSRASATPSDRPTPPPARGRGPAEAPRMTRGAREAATGMKVSGTDIQRCLDAPDDVSPDPNRPSRTRFRRGNLIVMTGADGMVLRVNRRKR